MLSLLQRCERYTLVRPQEVLLLAARWDDSDGAIDDEVMVFRGVSSSLMRPTASDPDVPILPETATIVRCDRLQAPYRPNAPEYLTADLDAASLEALLTDLNL